MEDLEGWLNKAIGEYRGMIESDPNLGRAFSGKPRTCLKGRNKFEVHVHLIRQMRDAYQRDDRDMLTKIPQYWGNDPGMNSVTFGPSIDEFDPFNNETSGYNVYWITGTLEALDSSGKTTDFSRFLCQKVEEYQSARDAVRDEILTSRAFSEAKWKTLECDAEDRPGILRIIYRDEEFKRKDRVIGLCDQAEYVYGLASRLFEGLRQDNA